MTPVKMPFGGVPSNRPLIVPVKPPGPVLYPPLTS
jgi:hypothetical protein